MDTCPAFITILTVTQESIGLPMILCGKMGPTKRKMLLIHMVAFLFEPSSKDIVKNSYIHIPLEVIEFLKSLHYWCVIRELTAWLIEREDDISRQIIKHVTDRYKDTPASS